MVTREQYIRRQQIIQNRMMKFFVPKVEAALRHQIDAANAVIKKKGIAAAQGNINGDILNQQIGPVITHLYRVAADIAFKKYKPNIKSFGDNSSVIDEVLAYLKDFLLQKVVVPISQTTVDQIEAVLQKGLLHG